MFLGQTDESLTPTTFNQCQQMQVDEMSTSEMQSQPAPEIGTNQAPGEPPPSNEERNDSADIQMENLEAETQNAKLDEPTAEDNEEKNDTSNNDSADIQMENLEEETQNAKLDEPKAEDNEAKNDTPNDDSADIQMENLEEETQSVANSDEQPARDNEDESNNLNDIEKPDEHTAQIHGGISSASTDGTVLKELAKNIVKAGFVDTMKKVMTSLEAAEQTATDGNEAKNDTSESDENSASDDNSDSEYNPEIDANAESDDNSPSEMEEMEARTDSGFSNSDGGKTKTQTKTHVFKINIEGPMDQSEDVVKKKIEKVLQDGLPNYAIEIGKKLSLYKI